MGESTSEVEERYGPHVEYFYNKMLHFYPGFAEAPGYRTTATIKAGLLGQTGNTWAQRTGAMRWKDFVAQGNVIAGTPSQVTEQLEDVVKSLNVGHLMLLNQIGSIPHDLAKENIRLTATRVLPKLRPMWEGQWENRWWPQPLRDRREPAQLLF